MFRLTDYEKVIRESASASKDSAADTARKFVYNLAVMRDHYTIFPSSLDFRRLGQQWNSLPSDVRLSQREELLHRVSRGL